MTQNGNENLMLNSQPNKRIHIVSNSNNNKPKFIQNYPYNIYN